MYYINSYRVFEINDHEELDPEYLMMWFEDRFDRYARFMSHGSTGRHLIGMKCERTPSPTH